jgi:protoheme IX farnesyltransferase
VLRSAPLSPGSGVVTALADPPDTRAARRSPTVVLRAYVALTKPRIIELLLVTTVPTMVLAARGLPSLATVLATLLGGTLAAGSANSLNCYLDRDIDARMRRTANRPLAKATVAPVEALVFGIVLGALSVLALGLLVNPLAAGLALAAILFYVLVYTLGLKRSTPTNIVWGGAAGCVPVLVGWAAVTDRLAWPPVVLFMVVFLWTPPHFWALALRFRDDYAAAGVPMLPVVAGPDVVARRIVGYSWALVAASLLLVPVAGMGWLYAGVAVVLGAVFLREAYRLLGAVRRGLRGPALEPMRLFHWSIRYLTLLFLAVALDPFLR